MTIFLLMNDDFVGDNNQLLGIQLALENTKLNTAYPFQRMKETDFDLSTLLPDDVICLAGSHGLVLANTIKEQKPVNLVLSRLWPFKQPEKAGKSMS